VLSIQQLPDTKASIYLTCQLVQRSSGSGYDSAAKHTDRPAQRIARSGRSSGAAGTIKLGQAKVIASRAIEKATGGKQGGGCAREDIQQQLDQQFKAHNDTSLRGVKDAKMVTDGIRDALNGGKD
jgi:hypothetical protein